MSEEQVDLEKKQQQLVEEYAKKECWIYSGLMAEPTMRYFESGGCVCDFGLALRKSKDDETVWLNCKAYGSLAEKFGEKAKGSRVSVLGEFEVSKYKGKDYLNFIVLMGD